MSTNAIWTTHCDSALVWGGTGRLGCQGWASKEDTHWQARNVAKAKGWKLVMLGHQRLDLCPPCYEIWLLQGRKPASSSPSPAAGTAQSGPAATST